MSLAETPRPRRTLSLPGHVRPPVAASPLSASATGAPADGHRVPKTAPPVLAPSETSPEAPDRDPRRLSRCYWERMVAELGIILGEPAPPLFMDRIPKPFRATVHADMVARYEAASPIPLAAWLRKWTKTEQFVLVLSESGGVRYDLDGNPGKLKIRRPVFRPAPKPVEVEAREPYDPLALSLPYHARMLVELVAILGKPVPVIFLDRIPVTLKIGIRADIIELYPTASPDSIRKWLLRWCGTIQYKRQVASGGWRFDLTGREEGEITADEVDFAKHQLGIEVAPNA